VKKLLTLAVSLALVPNMVQAQQIVALDDLDGNAVNLISSSVPALDGGGGDFFGAGSIAAWPQTGGVPFGLVDDTVTGISGAPFADDNEAVYGQAADFTNVFFALSDSDEFGVDQTASWTFNVDGFEDLELSVDIGGVSSDSFDGYSLDTEFVMTVSIDGAPAQNAIVLTAVDNTFGFLTRPMDDGDPSGGGRLLEASGDNGVTKFLVDSGSMAVDTFVDKAPASGIGAGELDSFVAPIVGQGVELTVTLTANLPFEAMAFDNIVIRGVQSPVSAPAQSFGELKSRF